MRTMFVAGNWKMHGTRASVAHLLEELVTTCADFSSVDIAVFPPHIFLDQTAHLLAPSNIQFGGQNLAIHSEGAYTGEIAGPMLKDFGCNWVIVGHSERRQYYGETDTIVAEKFAAAQKTRVQPILCVGETQAQREAGQTMDVIRQQLSCVVDLVGIEAFTNAVVAYEPVWAIGTGLTASPEQAQEIHRFIRDLLAVKDGSIAQTVRLLYGGSVKADNASGLFTMPDIDGALVGGASLKAEQFTKICQQAQR